MRATLTPGITSTVDHRCPSCEAFGWGTTISKRKSGLLLDRGSSFRPDLEGIRGIALLVILATHLIEWPTGGFVMLDLFFVLSGFLITGLLIKEYDKTRTIRLWRFSRRRIRRLAPAATLTIVVTVIAGYLLFPRARANSVALDGIWAMLLSANWRFVATGTDYFATWMPQSPLLHFWSLAVEEQFYLFWPLLILGAFTFGAFIFRRRQTGGADGTFFQRYATVITMIALVSAASFAWSVLQSASQPEVAYLSTLTRVWQLGFGALLYFANPLWKKIPFALRVILAWGGFAALLATAYFYTPEMPYPGTAAIVPVLATAAIIVSGVGGSAAFVAATNPVSRYLGQISYSTYLWHWPIFVYIAAVFGKESPIYLYAALPLAILIGALSFHFVENPVRTSQWLEPKAQWRRLSGWQKFDRIMKRAAIVAIPLAIAAVAFAMVAPRLAPTPERPAPVASATQTPTPDDSESTAQSADAELATVQASIVAALDADEWPADIRDQIGSGEVSPTGLLTNDCLDVSDANEAACMIGDASLPRTAVLLGDSVSLSWMPGLGPALNDLGYRVQLLNHSQCPFADVSVSGSFEPGTVRPGYPEDCNNHRAWAFDRIAALSPDLVIVSDGEAEMQTLMLPEGSTAPQYWQDGMTSALERLGTTPTIVLASPPQAASIAECYTNLATVEACTERMADQWRDQFVANERAVDAAGDNVHLVNTLKWFCTSDGWCPPFALDRVIRADRQHIADGYATALTPLLRETIGQLTPAQQ